MNYCLSNERGDRLGMILAAESTDPIGPNAPTVFLRVGGKALRDKCISIP
jgi:hypothetical protein